MKFPQLLLIIVVLILSVSELNGQISANAIQQKTVTKAEIDGLEKSAEAKLTKLSYRKKTKESEYKDGEKDPNRTELVTLEVQRPDRLREAVNVHSTGEAANAGFADYHSEYVEIGKKTYSKEGNEPWKTLNVRRLDPVAPSARPLSDNEQREYDYFYLGKQDLGGTSADHYQVTTKILINREMLGVTIKNIFFDSKGRFLKIESFYRNNVLKSMDQKIIDYEYDKPIKIEAPIK